MQKNKNTVKAINKNIRSSPRKINNLLKNIRGKKAAQDSGKSSSSPAKSSVAKPSEDKPKAESDNAKK